MGSKIGRHFKVTTFGESHGEALGCVIENCPAGLPLSEADIQPELDRRKPGQSNITTPRKEEDIVKIVSGISDGKTTGSPIAMIVYNENAREKDYSEFKDVFRPSHADYTYQAKYGHRAYRGGGRASARTTIGIVAAGAVAKKILKEKTDIEMTAYVARVHHIALPENYKLPELKIIQKDIENNDVRCPDFETSEKMKRVIQDKRQEGDSVGGIIEFIAENVPPGLGDPVFDRLDALLAAGMMAIPAVKAVSIGSGFEGTLMTGSEHNDIFYIEKGRIRTRSNFSGGIQGGISNGEPVFMKIGFKPTATIMKEQATVNDKGVETTLKVKGRHDPCVLPRAVPIVEATAALILVDCYLLNILSDINKI